MGPEAQKARGAYYTHPIIARFLLRFAVPTPDARVLDPCFGEAVFLRAAIERLRHLGGDPAKQVTGIEVDPQVHRAISIELTRSGLLGRRALHRKDFFEVDATTGMGRFTAVVGNPPFIRYQRFSGSQREMALKRALQAGVRLTALTSSWAPFIVHATTFLETGGRLAMVAPAELLHAAYARPVLEILARCFGRVRILTFARRLFPELSEDTVLILADGYGSGPGLVYLVSLHDVAVLTDIEPEDLLGVPIDSGGGTADVIRIIAHLLPEGTRGLYERLCEDPEVTRLGSLATAGIGYVTGNNDFFHLSADEADRFGIASTVLRRAVCRAGWLTGLTFSQRDWMQLHRAGEKTSLLYLSGGRRSRGKSVEAYLNRGRRQEVHKAYKCRVRDRWYAVPHVVIPDLFLTYMANKRPALVLNRAQAVAPNTLLCVRLDHHHKVTAEALGAAWWTSLTALSAEVEGHSLGAGMLKLEPGEAVRVLLPMPARLRDPATARRLVGELDRLIRREEFEQALDLGDQEVLQRGLGLTSDECALLRQGFHFLMERRRRR